MRTTLLTACLTAGAAVLGIALPAASHAAAAQPTATASARTGINASTPMPIGNLAHWRRVFGDNFTGSSLNTTSAWSAYANGAVPSNPTTAYWSPSHVRVGGGRMTIVGSRDASLHAHGRVVTEGVGLWKLPAQTYGKWKMLVRMDQCSAVKYAWLLWPTAGTWPADGEIDFAEDDGGTRAQTVASVLYQGADGSAATLPQDRITPARPMSGWHVVGVEWTRGLVRYTLDGKVWGSVHSSHVPSGPMTMVMQTESRTVPASVSASFSACNAQIGWVVQYAQK